MQACLINLYVSNLSRLAIEGDLHNAFSAFGHVTSATTFDEAG